MKLRARKLTCFAGDLRGREIQTEGGTKIGSVGDVIVDEKSKVVGFTLDRLQVQGPLAESRVIARAAITSLGDKNTPMVASLEQAVELAHLCSNHSNRNILGVSSCL